MRQPLVALGFANERRLAIAARLAEIRGLPFTAGAELAAAVLVDPSEHEESMIVGRLVCACERMGRTTSGPILRRAGVAPDRRLRELTERQRHAVADELRAWAKTRDARRQRARLREGRAA